ncbi:MAG: hypothetical protein FWH21_07450 [Kiritimatiellaeota bacterium]|nr:hypothetical protein [Kiritimatiellota bacterium]
MSKIRASFLFLGMFPIIAFGNGIERIIQMGEALQEYSMENFFSAVRVNQWKSPCIPSKWFMDTHVTDDDERRLMKVARDFGFQLALCLDNLAQEQQTLPPTDTLYQRTLLLCDLGDWCAETVGYGNAFLAKRCLDLSAVGLARLTASMEFSLEKCEDIAMRMHPKWTGTPYKLLVFNGEAKTNLFINTKMTSAQLDGYRWLARAMLATERNPKLAKERGYPPPPDPTLVNAGAFTNSLHLFDEEEKPPRPVTLVRSWDCRQHGWLIFLGGSQEHNQALALLKYRSVVGFFPSKFVRREEEIKRRDTEIEKYAKLGIKITKEEDNPSYDPLEEAFRRELEKLESAKTEGCSYSVAFIAYNRVLNGTFYDPDMTEIQTEKQREKIKAQSKMK